MVESSNHTQTRLPVQQLIRYGVVGVGSNVAIYLLYLLVTYLGLEPRKAVTLSYITGASIGFLANRQWTFAYRGTLFRTFCRYTVAHLFGYLLNFMMIFIFVERLGFAHQAVQAAAIILVAGFLFAIFKYFVFPADKNELRGWK